MAQDITVHLDDGRTFNFPEGTTAETIKAVVQKQGGLQIQTPSEILDASIKKTVPGIHETGSKASLVLDPTTVLSSVVGGAAGTLSANPVVGSLAMSAVDNFLRNGISEPGKFVGNTLVDTAVNEIGGRLIGKGLKTAKSAVGAFIKPSQSVDFVKTNLPFVGFSIRKDVANFLEGKNANLNGLYLSNAEKATITKYKADLDAGKLSFSKVENPGLTKLKPTFAQLLRSKGSKWAGMASGFEDLLSPNTKKAALQESFDLAKDEGDNFVNSLIGRTNKLRLDQPNELAGLIKEGEEKQFLKLKQESSSRGEAVKLIAEMNPIAKYDINTGLPTENKVNGPVFYKKAILEAQAIKNEAASSSFKPDPDSPVMRAVNDLLEATNATFDKQGNLIDFDPVDFKTAWKDKQVAGAIGWGSPMTDITFVDSRFKKLSHAIDDDIEASLPTWDNSGDKALQLFVESKAIVATRNTLFNPTNETGKALDTLINTVTKPTETLNIILDDPEKLKRYLITGKVQVPNRTRPFTDATGKVTQVKNFNYLATNARKDAQGYQLMRFLNESTVVNPLDNTKQIFDANKLNGLINDPNKQESLKILFGSQSLSNVRQFFKNLAFTSQKGNNIGASRYLALKVGAAGISLGTGVASTIASGSLATGVLSGGAVLGATIGAHGLARLMTNPNTARIMIAMAGGQPLNMSTQLATRILMEGLRNQPISIQYADGNSIDGKIKDGKFAIPLN